MRVLIVEDDPMMQLGLEQAFKRWQNFTLIGIAEDGYLGVEAALKNQPDLVVMDIGLPRMDGIAATQKIKQALPQTRVVMLTSHTSETEVVAALSSGADAYCIKGASLDRIYDAIKAASEGATYLDPQIARLVVNHLKPPTPQDELTGLNLSPREMEVLQLIVTGKSNNQIAEELGVSPNTIKTHVQGILNKLTVDDRVQAAVFALRSGLVQ